MLVCFSYQAADGIPTFKHLLVSEAAPDAFPPTDAWTGTRVASWLGIKRTESLRSKDGQRFNNLRKAVSTNSRRIMFEIRGVWRNLWVQGKRFWKRVDSGILPRNAGESCDDQLFSSCSHMLVKSTDDAEHWRTRLCANVSVMCLKWRRLCLKV